MTSDRERFLQDRCAQAVAQHTEKLLELSHRIHAEPELAFAEHRSMAAVAAAVGAHGFEVTTGVGGLDTAMTASSGGGELVVALCAEYDALPEIGHACGHNIIAAASVGAALALQPVADELGITIRLIGTPAEEIGGGKVLLLERGVFDGVAMAMMVHPSPYEICEPRSRAIADLEVHYRGRESHAAAAPELGVNAADALTVAQVAIGLARQHLEPGQQVHGIVTHGGAAPNIVPAHTSAMFNLRAAEMESLRRLEHRIRCCLEAGAVATGATMETSTVSPDYAELRADSRLVAAYREAIVRLGRVPAGRDEETSRIIGSTDMGNVTQSIPGIHPAIAIECGDAVPHQPDFAAACNTDSADRAVLDGATAMAWTVVSAVTNEGLRAELLAGATRRLATSGKPAATGGAA
ncbi:amidohydrolase [Actinoalloteichus hymeniacidonis]|uniref:Peptidase M20 domain-containing protein 2 n=1 Tax=Actinoalloteichus hymeniacidonis TaxID=340345 RepID=A0AAC9HUD8_9PSEU|nr:amidohydrolase [Actinoalloteichus hymeniacidonis]AOS65545.1 amidohydrolase [Actinoalloteichus hymeniacidonis]MBB5906367.1 amidohydrolase [Actinoalloteichus hymeniacidonis]